MRDLLYNKAFLVTGASSGIGSAVAKLLSKYGCRLFITGRNYDRLSIVQKSIGLNCHLEVADLCHAESAITVIHRAVDTFGPLDGMVHCAGVSLMQPMRYYTVSDFNSILTNNLISAFNLMACFRKKSNHAAESYVVFISSLLAHHGEKAMSEYSASKAGLEGAVRAWALEEAKEGIRINIVAPGYVKTPMLTTLQAKISQDINLKILERHPLGLGNPEDVANAIAFLLSPAARWITGTTLHVDGGFHAT